MWRLYTPLNSQVFPWSLGETLALGIYWSTLLQSIIFWPWDFKDTFGGNVVNLFWSMHTIMSCFISVFRPFYLCRTATVWQKLGMSQCDQRGNVSTTALWCTPWTGPASSFSTRGRRIHNKLKGKVWWRTFSEVPSAGKRRGKDTAQQKDRFERLLVLMTGRVQASTSPTLPVPAPWLVSPPCYHVLQIRNPLDNFVLGWPMQPGLNASWAGQMYPQQSSTLLPASSPVQ